MTTKSGGPASHCTFCGEEHPRGDEACEALRVAADAGARPIGVPVKVQAAYVEARRALRSDAPAVAIRVLQWLLSHLAETRGVNPDLTLSAKVAALSDAGIISRRIRPALIEQARSATSGSEEAWALMTLAEHALARAYLRRGGAALSLE
jgi:hypothetical protein